LLCIIETNLPYSRIRSVGLHCVQLPTASQINPLLNLFSFLVNYFTKMWHEKPQHFPYVHFILYKIVSTCAFAIDILHISVISFC
jgi:hypothetical protein